jgi:hypothetical protein
VVPRSRGGTHSWDNCVAACRVCNSRKSDRLLTELGWALRAKPGPSRRGRAPCCLGVEPHPTKELWLAAARSEAESPSVIEVHPYGL